MVDFNDKLAKADTNTGLSTWDGDISGIGTTQRPTSLDPNDLSGTEDIGADEVRIPRIGIAQGLSPQMTPGESKYIEGLTLFDMFNDQTGEILGKGPIHFIPIRRDVRRIEFVPRSEGGGVVDPDVPKGDPRLRWTKSSPNLPRADRPPAATEFHEFVVLMCRKGKPPEPIMLSIPQKNKWNRAAADKLNSVAKIRRATIYASVFSVDTKVPGKNDKGTFGVFTVRDLGFIPKDTPLGAALYKHAEDFYNSLEGKVVSTSRADDEVDDSMAANPEVGAGM
jgi:hypothetical protein